jgi:hypothetical protein
VTRADDDRPAVVALRENAEKLMRAAYLPAPRERATWVPAQDPHRETISALAVA